jgi:hypothetical protein
MRQSDAGDFRADLAATIRQLKAFVRVWERVSLRFDANDPRGWENVQRLMGQRASELFVDEFAPLADRVVRMAGRGRFPRDPPNPPLFAEGYEGGRMAEALFGVRDTLSAGRLCLIWGAMAHDPRRYRRPCGYRDLVANWAGGLAGVSPDEWGTARTWHQPMHWALAAAQVEYRRLRRRRADVAGAKGRGRGRPPIAQTHQRAEFAKTFLDEGSTWGEVHARYLRRFRTDGDCTIDALRLAFQRVYGPKR